MSSFIDRDGEIVSDMRAVTLSAVVSDSIVVGCVKLVSVVDEVVSSTVDSSTFSGEAETLCVELLTVISKVVFISTVVASVDTWKIPSLTSLADTVSIVVNIVSILAVSVLDASVTVVAGSDASEFSARKSIFEVTASVVAAAVVELVAVLFFGVVAMVVSCIDSASS